MNANLEKVKAIFLDALDHCAPADWSRYLDEACGSDRQVRQQVEALLQAHASGRSLLDKGAIVTSLTADQPETEQPGTQIGPYKLREQIGEGGFGLVCVAEQEHPVTRKVALKIIKPGMDTRDVIARFEAERQALALMDHPNVAKVLDAGATESGRPYFVMELVRGVPVTEFCDEHKLSTHERLKLFIDVCRAVQHAHQKGIIHRDLKPTNVMVTLSDDRPIVKVIDFGIAKALSGNLTDKSVYTAYGQMIGTPLYMSPEQAQMNEADVDTRSDVYSLGVLLYELLTGTTPFDKETLQKSGFDEMRRIIREVEPPCPSARVSTMRAELLTTIADSRRIDSRKLVRSYRGELDWIVMKALEKDRNRRYESASALAADVDHYLKDRPVQACPPTAWYRFRKFAQRRKRALAAVAIALVFVVTIASGAGWMARDRDARRARLAGQIDLILNDVGRLMKEHKWPEAFAVAKRVEPLIAGTDAEETTRQHVQRILADLKLLQRLDDARLLKSVWTNGGFDYARADRAYAAAFREYGVDLENLPLEESAAILRSRASIAVPVAVGLDEWATTKRQACEPDDSSWETPLAVAKLIDSDPVRNRLRELWGKQGAADTKNELTSMMDAKRLTAQPPATLYLLGKTLERAGLPHKSIFVFRLAQQQNPDDFWINFDLAASLAQLDQQDPDAIRFYSAALALSPGNTAVLNNLANVLRVQEKLDESLACCQKAIQIDPEFAFAHISHANVLRDKGRLDEAITCYRIAIKLNPNLPPTYFNLGYALIDRNEVDEAIECFRKTIELDQTNPQYHTNLGVALRRQKRLDEAIACYQRAIELDARYALAHYNLGIAMKDKVRLDEAIACYKRSVQFDEKFAEAYYNLAMALKVKGKPIEAIACLRKFIELDRNNADPYFNLGNALYDQQELDEAIKCFRKAISLTPNTAKYHNDLGCALDAQHKLDEAIACYTKAVTRAPDDAHAWRNRGWARYRLGQWRRALEDHYNHLKLAPDDVTALESTARILGIVPDHQLRDTGRALELSLRAVELEPRSKNAWRSLGWARFRNGQYEQAVEALEKSCDLQRGGGDPWQWLILAMAQWELGNSSEAYAWYDKSVAWALKGNLAVQSEWRRTELHLIWTEAEQLLEIANDLPESRACPPRDNGPSRRMSEKGE